MRLSQMMGPELQTTLMGWVALTPGAS
jgi:hypothetical protein